MKEKKDFWTRLNNLLQSWMPPRAIDRYYDEQGNRR